MRVSNLSINLTSYNIIHGTSSRYDKIITQMVSGMKIQKGSEDPILAQKGIYMSNLKASNDQYLKNAKDVKSLIDYSESLLGQTGDMLNRVKELAVQAASDIMTDDSRDAIVKEIDQIILEVVNIANQQYNGKYMFAGTNTMEKPFEIVGDPIDSIIYHGNEETIKFSISDTMDMVSNIPGSQVFLDTINDLISVRDTIKTGTTEDISNKTHQLIEDSIDRVINVRTELGAKSNICETTINRIETLNTELTNGYSNLMGVDLVEKQVELASLEVSYQASLSLVGKLHSMSILNYIK